MMSLFKPLSVWFIGLPCSGKSTLSKAVHARLIDDGLKSKVLDGDELRTGINSNLGFTITDRYENIRRAAEINKLFLGEGYIVLNALICPLHDMRKVAANIVGEDNFVEIFVDAPLFVCEKRDIKGMYKKARAGEITQFTGINSPFEPPVHPGLVIPTDQLSIEASVEKIFNFLKSKI
ncbi:MAG TPA: adenylyl-sulfate kinase [Bacteroidales bacterium]|nr:adenylyl-sulfate kinase [Bacteroidales bacterium]